MIIVVTLRQMLVWTLALVFDQYLYVWRLHVQYYLVLRENAEPAVDIVCHPDKIDKCSECGVQINIVSSDKPESKQQLEQDDECHQPQPRQNETSHPDVDSNYHENGENDEKYEYYNEYSPKYL